MGCGQSWNSIWFHRTRSEPVIVPDPFVVLVRTVILLLSYDSSRVKRANRVPRRRSKHVGASHVFCRTVHKRIKRFQNIETSRFSTTFRTYCLHDGLSEYVCHSNMGAKYHEHERRKWYFSDQHCWRSWCVIYRSTSTL